MRSGVGFAFLAFNFNYVARNKSLVKLHRRFRMKREKSYQFLGRKRKKQLT